LVERAFDGSHVDHLPERLLVRCDDDHLIRRVVPLTLIGKTDDGLAIRAPIAPPDNASHGVMLDL
jgi:hypothetical protein